jgi:hypothetical protein
MVDILVIIHMVTLNGVTLEHLKHVAKRRVIGLWWVLATLTGLPSIHRRIKRIRLEDALQLQRLNLWRVAFKRVIGRTQLGVAQLVEKHKDKQRLVTVQIV